MCTKQLFYCSFHSLDTKIKVTHQPRESCPRTGILFIVWNTAHSFQALYGDLFNEHSHFNVGQDHSVDTQGK